MVQLSNLPEQERRAYLERNSSVGGSPMGDYDDAAHMRLLEAPATMRAEADRKADIARFLISLGNSLNWPQREALVREKFPGKGTSKHRLKAILKAVDGVDPINYAPALLPKHKGRTATAEMSDDAWSFFMTIIRDASPDFPIMQAWRDVRDVAKAKEWHWPPYITINRRWNALPKAEQMMARYGRSDTLKALAQPA